MQIEPIVQDKVPTFEEEESSKKQNFNGQKVVLNCNTEQIIQNQQNVKEELVQAEREQEKNLNNQKLKKAPLYWKKEEEYLFVTFLVGSLDQIEDIKKPRIPFGWYRDMASFIKTRSAEQCRAHYRKRVNEMDLSIKQFVKQQIVFKKETNFIYNPTRKMNIKTETYIYKLLGVKFDQQVFSMLDTDVYRFKQVFLNKLQSQHSNDIDSQQALEQQNDAKTKKTYRKNKKTKEPEIDFQMEDQQQISQRNQSNADKKTPRAKYSKQEKNKLRKDLQPITSVVTTICDCQNTSKGNKDQFQIERQKDSNFQVNEKQIEKQVLKSAEKQLQIIKKRIIGQLTCSRISSKTERNQKLVKLIESLAKCELEQMFAIRFRLKILNAYQEKCDKMIKNQELRQHRKTNLWISHLHKLKRDRKRIIDLEKKFIFNKQKNPYQEYGLNSIQQKEISEFNQLIKKSNFLIKYYENKIVEDKPLNIQRQKKVQQKKAFQSVAYQQQQEQEEHNDRKSNKKGQQISHFSAQRAFKAQASGRQGRKRKPYKKKLESLGKNQPNLIIMKSQEQNQSSKKYQPDLTMEILKNKIAAASIQRLQNTERSEKSENTDKPDKQKRPRKQKKASQKESQKESQAPIIYQEDAVKFEAPQIQTVSQKVSAPPQKLPQVLQQIESQHSLQEDQQQYYMLESVSKQNFILQENQDNKPAQKMDVQNQQQKAPDNLMNQKANNFQQDQSRLPDLSNTIRLKPFMDKKHAPEIPRNVLIKQEKPEVYQIQQEPEIFQEQASESSQPHQHQPKKQTMNPPIQAENVVQPEQQVYNKIEEQPSSNEDDKRQKDNEQILQTPENKKLKIEESDKRDVNLDVELNSVFKDMFGKYMIFEDKPRKNNSGPLIQ